MLFTSPLCSYFSLSPQTVLAGCHGRASSVGHAGRGKTGTSLAFCHTITHRGLLIPRRTKGYVAEALKSSF